jgi:hypothetical protein
MEDVIKDRDEGGDKDREKAADTAYDDQTAAAEKQQGNDDQHP